MRERFVIGFLIIAMFVIAFAIGVKTEDNKRNAKGTLLVPRVTHKVVWDGNEECWVVRMNHEHNTYEAVYKSKYFAKCDEELRRIHNERSKRID